MSGPNPMDGTERDGRERAAAEAAALLVRASFTAPDDLDHWLAAAPANAPAYVRTLSMWNDLGEVMAAQGPPAPVARAMMPPPRRRGLPLAAVLSALACMLLALVGTGYLWLSRPPVFSTEVGEQRIVVLKDGTRVTLNTDTEIAIADSERQRRVILRRGEALFEVAHDPAHPFVVEARDALVQALGTSFVVRSDTNRLDVILLVGRVKIDRSARGESTLLTLGDRFSEIAGGAGHRDRPKLEAVTAWRNGELVLDNTPLPEAVAEMNRYSERPIVLAGAQARAMRLSGVFRTRDSENFANTVGAISGLRVTGDAKALHIGGGR